MTHGGVNNQCANVIFSPLPRTPPPQVSSWMIFLEGFGFSPMARAQLLTSSPQLLLSASLYEAGQVGGY